MTLKITNAGLNVLLRALSGDNIVFTKVQIGNGDPQAPATAEALSNPLLELSIQSVQVSTTNATLKTKFNNNTVEAGFRHTETGIWVQNQDDDTQEVLYAYGTQPDATADYISASGDSILETQMDFLVFVGESQNISAVISESLVYASAADLKSHVEHTGNPHNVTATQVGLGDVPNVPTNDQTPTYTVATALSALVSGEKLSTAFSKLAKTVLALIAHLKDYQNPHKVVASQIGAAAASHGHSTTDIKSGTLGIARGGTGATTVAAARNALGLGNTSGALPVANGGTGATTVAAARNTLGLGNTSGALPIANGGTGATNGPSGLQNLFASGNTILSSYQYGNSLPAAGKVGRIFFKKV